MSDRLMQEMFIKYNSHLAGCMADKKKVGDEERRDAMRAALRWLAENVSDEMGEEFNKAHVAYWDKHWVDGASPSFGKVRKAADRKALSAALLKASEIGE